MEARDGIEPTMLGLQEPCHLAIAPEREGRTGTSCTLSLLRAVDENRTHLCSVGNAVPHQSASTA
jgi:hypothetical protein